MILIALLASWGVPHGYVPTLTFWQPPTLSTTVPAQSAALDPTGDNSATFQAFFDFVPAGAVVLVPPGTWNLHSMVRIAKATTLESSGTAANTTLKGVSNNQASRYVLDVGNYGTDVKANNVTLRRITFDASGLTGDGIHGCLFVHGDAFTMQDSVVRGSHHEGVAGGGMGALIERCQAIECGNGSAWYTNRSTAGFNVHSHNTVYRDCEAIDCGQGFEMDGYNTIAERCIARMTHPPVASPAIGYNVGSTGTGIWNIKIQYSKTFGYASAVETGNGIGTFASVSILDNVFDDGGVSFMGGVPTNSAPGAIPPGMNPPDTGQSHVDRNVFISRGDWGASAAYSTTPAATGSVYGREPCTFNDNVFINLSVANPFIPALLNIAGNVTAPVEWKRNKIFGWDVAPQRGDGATFTYNENPAVPGQPSLTSEHNLAFKKDGTERTWDERRQGP